MTDSRWKIELDHSFLQSEAAVNVVLVLFNQRSIVCDGSDEMLSEEERTRAARFVQQKDRSRFVAGRQLIRQLFAHELGVEHRDVAIALDQGRPFIEKSDESINLPFFNISHAGSAVALAWSRNLQLGIDVEVVKIFDRMEEVARRVMTSEEIEEFFALAQADQLAAFYRLWVRKEAILKQMYAGFSIEPNCLSVELHGDTDVSEGSYGDKTFWLYSGGRQCCLSSESMVWSLATTTQINPEEIRVEILAI